MEYILMIIGAVLVNNIVLAQFLGICPFLGVSNKVSTALSMGVAVIFVITLATLVTTIVNSYVLIPLHLDKFLQTIVFILIIAALVQMVEIILKKMSPVLYQALGIFLPLITTNCAVLGIAILVTQKFPNNLIDSMVYAIATA
ncbi:MAG: electron transport complex subunit RsxA, partial [Bacteroidales bacterium]|nr:electron transport complex subunit RsxA [Bacteroidales bacterium]